MHKTPSATFTVPSQFQQTASAHRWQAQQGAKSDRTALVRQHLQKLMASVSASAVSGDNGASSGSVSTATEHFCVGVTTMLVCSPLLRVVTSTWVPTSLGEEPEIPVWASRHSTSTPTCTAFELLSGRHCVPRDCEEAPSGALCEARSMVHGACGKAANCTTICSNWATNCDGLQCPILAAGCPPAPARPPSSSSSSQSAGAVETGAAAEPARSSSKCRRARGQSDAELPPRTRLSYND
mmetsp:Transcript_105072/g.266927  ORF Transcript_105072/g.266927 Transcript_105072/m.266927 type:complete len:239 (+) Transcript_105072:125-841(+)